MRSQTLSVVAVGALLSYSSLEQIVKFWQTLSCPSLQNKLGGLLSYSKPFSHSLIGKHTLSEDRVGGKASNDSPSKQSTQPSLLVHSEHSLLADPKHPSLT